MAKTPKVGARITIKEKGKKPMSFTKGNLHKAVHVPQGTKIPASKMRAAAAGKYGAKAKKEALFAENVLKKGRKTAIRHKKEHKK